MEEQMLTVHKYELPFHDEFSTPLPMGAKILTFQAQRETPCIWALVDPAAPEIKRRFRLAGTGHPIGHEENGLRYIGTAQFRGGSLVFHLFEVID
jgi:hypothetical protein